MKKLLLFLLFIPVVFAFYGGESQVVYDINDCFSHSYVNVSGSNTITEGEYSFFNCSVLKTNYWKCPCSGDYELVMKTTEEAVNVYTLEIDYIYDVIDSSSGGGTTIAQYKNSYAIKSTADLPLDKRFEAFEIIKNDKGEEEVINSTQDLNIPKRLRNKDIIQVIVEDVGPIKQQQQLIFLIVAVAIFVLVLLLLGGIYIIFR